MAATAQMQVTQMQRGQIFGQIGYWPFLGAETLGENLFGYALCLTYLEVERLSYI